MRSLDIVALVCSSCTANLVGMLAFSRPGVLRCLGFQLALALIGMARHAQALLPSQAGSSLLGMVASSTAHLPVLVAASMALHVYQAYFVEQTMSHLQRLVWQTPLLIGLVLDVAIVVYGSLQGPSPHTLTLVRYAVLGAAAVWCLYASLAMFAKSFAPPPSEYMADTMRNLALLDEEAANARRKARASAIYPLLCFACFFGGLLLPLLARASPLIAAWALYGPGLFSIGCLFALLIQPKFRHELRCLAWRKPHAFRRNRSKRLPSQDLRPHRFVTQPLAYP